MHSNLAGDLVTPASEDARKPLGDKATFEAFSESSLVTSASEDTGAGCTTDNSNYATLQDHLI